MLFVPQITILDPMSSVQIVREMKDVVKYLGNERRITSTSSVIKIVNQLGLLLN